MENNQNQQKDLPRMEPTERERLKPYRVPITWDTLIARRFRWQGIGMIVLVLSLIATLVVFPSSIAVQIDLSTMTPHSYLPTLLYVAIILGVGIFVYLRGFTADRLAYIRYASSIPMLLALHMLIFLWNLL